MATTTGSSRRARAAANERAAKERRQKLLIAFLGAVLVVVLVFELPRLLKSSGSSSSSSPAVTTPAAPGTSVPAKSSSAALKRVLKLPPRDIFARTTGGGGTTLGSVSTPPGLHDPFAQPKSTEAAVAPVAPTKTVTRAPVLPSKIVIGTPGKGKVAVTGWIVILASIPTEQGQGSANAFAQTAARSGIGKTSVLNSSNRKPLRGGYWVVYVGPYTSITKVSLAADNVHKAGFTSAYIRELIVYKKKTKK